MFTHRQDHEVHDHDHGTCKHHKVETYVHGWVTNNSYRAEYVGQKGYKVFHYSLDSRITFYVGDDETYHAHHGDRSSSTGDFFHLVHFDNSYTYILPHGYEHAMFSYCTN